MLQEAGAPKSESQLFALAADGDSQANSELVTRYIPLARRLAGRYQRSDEPLEDLQQVAALGLVQAIMRFDARRGIAFSTYAVPTILGELRRYFRDRTWSVRVPRDLQERVLRLEREQRACATELHRSPTVEEMSDRLGLSRQEVLEAYEARGAQRSVSLDAPAARSDDGDARETVGDTVGDEEPGYGRVEQRVLLDALMRTVTQREREVLRLRYEEDLTQAEIGEIIGVSQMQVSRILRRAVDDLRDEAAGEDGPEGAMEPTGRVAV